MSNVLSLDGCRPTPLASYLKALAVLRLVTESPDPTARGFWRNERFQLNTALDRDGLRRFFLDDYAPTPIIAPWNGRAGFLEGDSASEQSGETLDLDDKGGQELSSREGARLRRSYEGAAPSRFQKLRKAAQTFASLPTMIEMDKARAGWKELEKKIGKRKRTPEETTELARLKKVEKRAKEELVAALRSEVAEDQYAWLDACIRLADSGGNSPLLIGGGADGSRDYGMAFGSALQKLFHFEDGAPREPKNGPWISAALFGEATPLQECESFGHFQPGQGGYNATTGYEGSSPLNPWDVILALEGAVLWSGGVTRRFENAADGSAGSFPFSFSMNRSGAGQVSASDPNRAPGELWCPIWPRPTGLRELQSVFREGRLTLGKRTARNGLDAALAVAALGRSRGMASFVRVGLYQSDAKMPHTATALSRHIVGSAPEAGSLALELVDHRWMSSIRRQARAKGAPAILRDGVKMLEDALFELTSRPRQADAVQAALIAVGDLARIIADRPKLGEDIYPPPRLSRAWATAADDKSREFRLAAVLAGLRAKLPAQEPVKKADESDGAVSTERDRTQYGLQMVQHLAPLDPSGLFQYPAWNREKGGVLAVWGPGRLVDNLCAVAQRRLIEASRLNLPEKPFDAPFGADSDTIAALFEDSQNFDERVAKLLAALVWVTPAPLAGELKVRPLPFAYAVLKPLFATHADLVRTRYEPEAKTPDHAHDLADARVASVRIIHELPKLPIPPALPALLMSGRVEDAVRLAQERARASGLPTPFLSPRRSGSRSRLHDVSFGRCLLAALIVPVVDGVLRDCLDRAYPLDKETNNAA